MTAYEARAKLNKELAKESVKRFYPLIEKAISKKQKFIYVKVKDITEEEIDILLKDGYKYEVLDDDSGDYHKSSKVIGYNFHW